MACSRLARPSASLSQATTMMIKIRATQESLRCATWRARDLCGQLRPLELLFLYRREGQHAPPHTRATGGRGRTGGRTGGSPGGSLAVNATGGTTGGVAGGSSCAERPGGSPGALTGGSARGYLGHRPHRRPHWAISRSAELPGSHFGESSDCGLLMRSK